MQYNISLMSNGKVFHFHFMPFCFTPPKRIELFVCLFVFHSASADNRFDKQWRVLTRAVRSNTDLFSQFRFQYTQTYVQSSTACVVARETTRFGFLLLQILYNGVVLSDSVCGVGACGSNTIDCLWCGHQRELRGSFLFLFLFLLLLFLL